MAITLDELLGSNMQATQTKVSSFPTFEEFQSRRNSNVAPQPTQSTLVDNNYDYYAQRPYTQPQTVEQARAYYQSQTYSAPRQNEFNGNYNPSFINNAYAGEQVLPQPSVAEENEFTPKYGNEEYKPLSLFEFTVHDNDRLSNGELDQKLSYSANQQLTMAFNGEIAALPSKKEKREARVKAHIIAKQKEKKQRKLSVKASILLGVYVAFLVTIVVLIGVNAKKINTGKVLVPTGNTQIEQVIDK